MLEFGFRIQNVTKNRIVTINSNIKIICNDIEYEKEDSNREEYRMVQFIETYEVPTYNRKSLKIRWKETEGGVGATISPRVNGST